MFYITICTSACLLSINTSSESETIPFSRNKLLQITSNLISNAIKFTPNGGKVTVNLSLKTSEQENLLCININDSGGGLTEPEITIILSGMAASTAGTSGKAGYGLAWRW